jgi:CysZ protein
MGRPVSLFVDFSRAISQLNDPRFFRVLALALGITIAGLVVVFWAVMLVVGWFLPDTVVLPWIGPVTFVDDVASWTAFGLMIVLSVILMVPVAAGVVGLFLDGIVSAVEARHYPNLPPVTELGLSEQVWDALVFFCVVVAANGIALAIYFLLPPFAPFIFWVVNGYLLGREYFTLVAMRRLGRKGAAALRERHMARIWIAGTLMAIPLSIPVFNLIVPVLGVAVFTHQYHRLAGPRGPA